MSMQKLAIAYDVKAWRLRLGWTAKEAADALGISGRLYADLDKRIKAPDVRTMLACQFLEWAGIGPAKLTHLYQSNATSVSCLNCDKSLPPARC